MEFNNTKFELLQYGLNFVIKQTVKYFAPDGTQITAKSHVKDLGVLMSSDGTFSEQINKICQSARDMCSWILRTFKSRSPVLMKTTWRTLVLPILDYCSQLWCPTKPGQIKQIESIQQSFTRKIASNASNYWERLSNFKLYSLQRRRERYRIIYVWKILESHVPKIPKKVPKINDFSTKMAAILEKSEKSKFCLQNFFAPICTTTWPNFKSIGPPQQKP